MTISPTPQSTAWHAVRAALNVNNWGLFAARRYAEKHGAGAYFTLARVLANAERAGL